MQIKVNFTHDIANLFKKAFISQGIKIPLSWDDKDVCLNYFELQKRWLKNNIQYKVFYSKELLTKLPSLSVEEQKIIKKIESKLKSGKNITSFMSKLIRNTDIEKSDFFMKNWNIYHLHIEEIKSLNQKYTNSNLLFFHPTEDSVYFIDVRPHPSGSSWYCKDLIEIEHNNWPNLHKYLKGFKPTNYIPDNKMHNTLKHFITTVDFHDGILFPSNMGVVASGNSYEAVYKSNYLFSIFDIIERKLKEQEKEIVRKIKESSNITHIEELKYELVIENDSFVVIETNYSAKINIPLTDQDTAYVKRFIKEYQAFTR